MGVFVHSNKAFRPPANGDTAMIMVGPGTGIAPFRAFLHERAAPAARKGKNWLFFGDQRAVDGFSLPRRTRRRCRRRACSRASTPRSRAIRRKKSTCNIACSKAAVELYAWLEAGAHFYVCGDASRMAKDVDAALHQVIERAGGKTAAQAADYVQALKAAKRYARDVY